MTRGSLFPKLEVKKVGNQGLEMYVGDEYIGVTRENLETV
jgi:hypothetical protein